MSSPSAAAAPSMARLAHRHGDPSGTLRFRLQRVTSMLLIPLTAVVIGVGLALVGREADEMRALVARPLVALPLAVFIVAAAWHMKLGLQEVIEDYVHAPRLRGLLLAVNLSVAAGVGLLASAALLTLMIRALG